MLVENHIATKYSRCELNTITDDVTTHATQIKYK